MVSNVFSARQSSSLNTAKFEYPRGRERARTLEKHFCSAESELGILGEEEIGEVATGDFFVCR